MDPTHSPVFLSLRVRGVLRAVLSATPGHPVAIPAQAHGAFAIHGPQGARITQAIRLRRQGDHLEIDVTGIGQEGVADFIIERFFQLPAPQRPPFVSDFEGVPYLFLSAPMSDYWGQLKSDQWTAVSHQGAVQPAGSDPQALHPPPGAAPLLTLATPLVTALEADAAGTAIGRGVVEFISAAPVVARYADLDGNRTLDIQGQATPGALITVVAPDGLTSFTTVTDSLGNYAVEVDVLSLAQPLGLYEITAMDPGATQASSVVIRLVDVTSPTLDYRTEISLEGPDSGEPMVIVSEDGGIAYVGVKVVGVHDGADEKLLVGATALDLLGSDRTGSVVLGDDVWAWTRTASGFEFSMDAGLDMNQTSQLIQALWWRNDALFATPGERGVFVTVSDMAGNVSLPFEVSSGGALGVLAWDLDGDQQVTYGQVLADTSGDALLDYSTWVGPNDAILLWDRFGDGVLHGLDQFAFGNATGRNALPALAAQFDANTDGIFDARDPGFAQFGLWQDSNANAQIDSGEWQGLSAAGVTALDLMAAAALNSASAGAAEVARGSAQGDGGVSHLYVDAVLSYVSPTLEQVLDYYGGVLSLP